MCDLAEGLILPRFEEEVAVDSNFQISLQVDKAKQLREFG